MCKKNVSQFMFLKWYISFKHLFWNVNLNKHTKDVTPCKTCPTIAKSERFSSQIPWKLYWNM